MEKTKMDFHEATNRFFLIFYFLGHCKKQEDINAETSDSGNLSFIGKYSGKFKKSDYKTFSKPSNKIADILCRVCQYIPLLLLIVLNVSITLAALVYTPRSKGKFSESNYTVAHLFVANSFVTVCTIIVQHFSRGDVVRYIRREIRFVEKEAREKLQVSICFRKVRNIFYLKIALMLGTYAQAIGMFFLGSLVLKKFTICPLAYALSVITDTSCLYAIFCIDFVHKTLTEINVILKKYDRKLRDRSVSGQKAPIEPAEPAEVVSARIVEKIEVLKQMYLSAWILTQQINRTFGWFFVAYLIQQFIDLAADLFWLFLINHDDFSYKIVFIISYLMCTATGVVLLINSCEYCTKEAEEISGHLLKINLPHAAHGSAVNAAKHEFLQQIFNQRIELSAKGFFAVNRRFLATLATACVTYVIILLQFQIAAY